MIISDYIDIAGPLESSWIGYFGCSLAEFIQALKCPEEVSQYRTFEVARRAVLRLRARGISAEIRRISGDGISSQPVAF